MLKKAHIVSLATFLLRTVAVVAAMAVPPCAFGQISMSFAPGSRSPGSAVPLNLSMSDPSGAHPTSLQWTLTYSSTDFSGVNVAAGTAATAAGKGITCNNTVAGTSTCVISGLNQTAISAGLVATVTLTVSPSTINTSSSVPFTTGMASSASGGLLSSINTGTTVTIVQAPTPTLTGVSCSPSTVSGGQSSICTVTLSSNVRSGSIAVGLSENISLVSMPTSVTVLLNNSSATFTATTSTTSTTTGVTITAIAGAVSKTTVLTVSAACTYTLTPNTRLFTSAGGSTTVTVTAGTGCAWTATTDSASWVTLPGGSVTGNGNGSFVYSVVLNLTSARLGKITVGNASFKVMEGGLLSLVPFNDILPSDPFFDYVSLMSSYGITVGCQTSPPLYCGSTPATRAQMAVFIVRGLDLALGTSLTFPPVAIFQDVPSSGVPDSIYFSFVQRISQLGITAGCQTTPALYCPDTSITQAQMAVFMIRAWMLANNLTTFTYSPTPHFTDVATTDIYFSYIQKMAELGFWTGCTATTYCENNPVSRDQMAPMILRSMLGAP